MRGYIVLDLGGGIMKSVLLQTKQKHTKRVDMISTQLLWEERMLIGDTERLQYTSTFLP